MRVTLSPSKCSWTCFVNKSLSISNLRRTGLGRATHFTTWSQIGIKPHHDMHKFDENKSGHILWFFTKHVQHSKVTKMNTLNLCQSGEVKSKFLVLFMHWWVILRSSPLECWNVGIVVCIQNQPKCHEIVSSPHVVFEKLIQHLI